MDATTESIAHFIGLFEIATEGGRLRLTYDKIKLAERIPDALGELDPQAVRLQAPYEIEPYDPGLVYEPSTTTVAGQMDDVPRSDRPTDLDLELPEIRLRQEAGSVLPHYEEPSSSSVRMKADIDVPFASSVVSFTWQNATLFDDDLFFNGDDGAFVDTTGLHATFAALVELAATLEAFDVPMPGEDWELFAEEVIARLDVTLPTPAGAGFEAHIQTGADAPGILVNGERVDEIPLWSDLLPEYLKPEFGPGDDNGHNAGGGPSDETPGAEEQSGAERGSDGAGSVSSATAAAGTAISTDGDIPLGQSRTETAAPAGGDPVPEHDFSRDFEQASKDGQDLLPPKPGHEIVSGANLAVNEVSIKSSWLDAPVFVVRGDVLKIDAVSQVNVLVESDRGGTPGEALVSTPMNVIEFIDLPGSEEDDESGAGILPQNWQVTRITGDVLTVNWVEQTTFMTDFDGAVLESVGTATYLGLGGNQVSNLVDLTEIGFFYDLIFVENMIDIDMVSQVNVLFDSDEITGAGAGATRLSTKDNLLYNQVTLKTIGIDEIVDMKPAFAQAAADLKAGATTLAREVAQDALFEGMEALRVLQIDGNFISANLITQKNLVGDADRIRLEMKELQDDARPDAHAEVIAGSNALMNIASIEKFGIDSKIMVAKSVYEDAMLYQAELIDDDAIPTGVGLQPLANEAIAFLADSMIAPRNDDIGNVTPVVSSDHPGGVDVMQAMLA